MRAGLWFILALLALTACSPVPPPPSVDIVEQHDDAVIAFSSRGTSWISRDSGHTWMEWSGKPSRRPQTSECRASSCYRVVPGRLAVEQSLDGGVSWRPAWSVPPGRTELLARALDLPEGDLLQSSSLVVLERPGGRHVVVVANTYDGLAVRDENGRWSRYGANHRELSQNAALPLARSAQAHILPETTVAVLAGIWALLAGFLLALPPSAAERRALGVLLGVGSLPIALAAMSSFSGLFLTSVLGWAATLAILIASATIAATARIGTQAVTYVFGAGIVVTLSVLAPFRLWTGGWPDSYGTAAWLAAGAGLTTASITLMALRRHARHAVLNSRH